MERLRGLIVHEIQKPWLVTVGCLAYESGSDPAHHQE
jgi:hypothetical protein